MNPAQPWLTSAEAADYLRVSLDTLIRWTQQGRIPSHRLPGARAYRYHAAELDAVLGLDVDAARSQSFAKGPAGSWGFAEPDEVAS